jgi:CDP-2,3-bis-(O-geranylgeranyl)-sn-glycerol synthase
MVNVADLWWLVETVYIYLPAYIANATPVILGGGKSLDGDRNWVDGKPILGDHKTVRGTFTGIAAGFLVGLLQKSLVRGTLLSIGAIGGDLIVSFFKRRLGYKPGALFPIADQMGFIIFAVILVSLTDSAPEWERALGIILATLPIHYLTNVIAWVLKLKNNPW